MAETMDLANEYQGFRSVASMYNNQHGMNNHGLPTIRGIPLVSTQSLPDRFRSIFSFPNFNAVQSKCFPTVYNTNENLVVSSPTGSGKTIIFELAICHLNTHSTNSKIVYMAPTKSLCSERCRDWQKFNTLGLKCVEITGDAQTFQRSIQQADIIITTPEKWDSITRKGPYRTKLMQIVKLFLIDEVHTLKEDRGATLEAVVARMKLTQPRFIALSATIPNCQDISAWLGARLESFSEDFRPVPITKHVCGFTSSLNDFAFEKMLSSKLPAILTKYGNGKPVLVFCSTRAACTDTAKQLSIWWQSARSSDRWSSSSIRLTFANEDLQDVSNSGIAFHHAGLSKVDRDAVEKAFLGGQLNTICCTSILATGMNLPCHMVVIKNTATFHQDASKRFSEYSDLDIIQMLGRAGRPQFDNTAVAVIMTRSHRVQHYEQLVSGEEVVESRLHLHLLDHINAEIRLGTITDIRSAKAWISSTFLYQRLKQNPSHYQIDDQSITNLNHYLDDICRRGLSLLQEHQLIQRDQNKYRSTPLGDAMASYHVQFETMKTFITIKRKASMPEILVALSKSAEFEDIHFRSGEKQAYRDMNKLSLIRYPLQIHIDLTWQKIFLAIQMALSKASFPGNDRTRNQDFYQTKNMLFKHIIRLIRALQECAIFFNDAAMAGNAFSLGRSLHAEAWDDLPIHLSQISGIGTAMVNKLSQAGIRSTEDMRKTANHRLEQILSRNPPFGTQLLQQVDRFPGLRIQLDYGRSELSKEDRCIKMTMTADIKFTNVKPIVTHGIKAIQICLLAATSDGTLVYFTRKSASEISRNGKIIFEVDLKDGLQSVQAQVMCEEIAGTCKTTTIKPTIPTSILHDLSRLQPAQAPSKTQHAADRSTNSASLPRIRSAQRDEDYGDEIMDQDLLGLDNGIKQGYEIDDDFDVDMNDANITDDMISIDRPEPQLPPGKYRCRHNCKDRTSCKHLCCREGLDKPPRPSRSKDHAEPTTQASQAAKNHKSTLVQTALSWPKSSDETSAGSDNQQNHTLQTMNRAEDIAERAAYPESDHPQILDENVWDDDWENEIADVQPAQHQGHNTATTHNAEPRSRDQSLQHVSIHQASSSTMTSTDEQQTSPSSNLASAPDHRYDEIPDHQIDQAAIDLVKEYLGTKLFVFVD